MKKKKWLKVWAGVAGVALVIALVLTLVPAELTITSEGILSVTLKAVSANPDWLSGWDYRKAINITGQTGAGANYQIPLTVNYAAGGSWGSFGLVQQVVDGDSVFGDGRTEDSKVVKVGSTYYMFISWGASSNAMRIYCLSSSSLTGTWSKVQADPVIAGGANSAWDEHFLRPTSITLYDGTWYLYYMGQNDSGVFCMGVATTSSASFPTGWSKYGSNPILEGTGSGWEQDNVGSLWMRRVGDTGDEWYGHYAAQGTNSQIGVCYDDSPYGPFTRYASNPVVTAGVGGTWDDFTLSRADLLEIDGVIYGVYEGLDDAAGTFQVGEYSGTRAANIENTTFTKNANNPIITGTAGSGVQSANPCWHYENGIRYLFVGGLADGDTWRYIDLFKSEITTDIVLNEHCRTDFGDIRFTDNDGTTELDFWMESKTDSEEALFWVEVADDLGSNVTVYVYYGKATATYPTYGDDTLQGAATFSFFDHFLGSSLNATKWDEQASPTITVSGSEVEVKTVGGTVWKGITTDDTFGAPYNIAWMAKGRLLLVNQAASTWQAQVFGMGADQNPNNEGFSLFWYYYNAAYRKARTSNASQTDTVVSNADESDHDYEALWKSGEVKFYVDGTLKATHTTNIPDSAIKCFAGAYASTGVTATAIMDWVLVRKYNDPEPSFSAAGSEKNACSEDISNTPSSWSVNSGTPVATSLTYTTGLTHFQITNNSGGAVDIDIRGIDMTGGNTWTLSDTATPSSMVYGLKAGLGGGDYTIIVKKNSPYNELVGDLADEGTQQWGLKLYTPTAHTDGATKTGTVTITATCV